MELVGPDHYVAKLQEPPVDADPDSARRGAASHLQRLLGRRRRHRRSRLRELRHPGGLRAARQARHRRQGQDRRSRATAGAGAASSRRWRWEHGAVGCIIYSDPTRRRLLPGRRLPDRRVPAGAGRAARQRDGHADLSRRSADARLGVRARRQEARSRDERKTLLKIPVLPISYGDALPLLRSLQGPGRAGDLARRAADHVSRRAGPGEGPPEAGVRLAASGRSTTSSPGSRARSFPTSGSSTATITTRGSTARRIRPAATSR